MSHSSTVKKPPKILQAGPADLGLDAQQPNIGKQYRDMRSSSRTVQPPHTPSGNPAPESRGQPVTLTKPSAQSSPTPLNNPLSDESPLLPQHGITAEFAQQFLALLRAAVGSNQPSQPAPNNALLPSPQTPDTTKKEADVGRASRLECKTIREVWNPQNGKYEVTELADLPGETSEYDQYVFVDRTRVHKKEETIYIDIKSEGLRDILGDVLGDMKAINLRADKPTIERRVLYNSLPHLKKRRSALMNVSQTNTSHRHLDLLISHIEETHQSLTGTLQPLLDHGEITFDLLWALFRSNEILLAECPGTGKPRCIKFDSGEFVMEDGVQKFRVEGCHFDYDGQRFGEVSTRLSISKFQGRKQIKDLDVFPLKHHPNQQKIREQLTNSGRNFIQLIGTHHRRYSGRAFTYIKGERIKFDVDSRIMVDAKLFREMNPNHFQPKISQSIDLDGITYVEDTSKIADTSANPSVLSDEDLLRCNPTVLGFSFRDKMWLEFAVADIHEISWQPSIFAALTIPQDKKDTILSLAEARTGHLETLPFDDFVAGKGRGLNILMHGPPGVGKTLTAEAMAEYLQRPMYSVCAGELGTNAAVLEERLTQIFRLSGRWNAILLMDEADIYMEQRTIQDLHRNALVSVFLRNLEYCEAIMFLTTNRVKTFDDAIISRIHMMIAYPDVGFDARQNIWSAFIKRAHTSMGPAKVEAKDLRQLARKELNARQIKNVVATAHALASKEKAQVTVSHLEKAVQSSVSFWEDLNGIVSKRGMYQ